MVNISKETTLKGGYEVDVDAGDSQSEVFQQQSLEEISLHEKNCQILHCPNKRIESYA